MFSRVDTSLVIMNAKITEKILVTGGFGMILQDHGRIFKVKIAAPGSQDYRRFGKHLIISENFIEASKNYFDLDFFNNKASKNRTTINEYTESINLN
jgi:hypothetical protein